MSKIHRGKRNPLTEEQRNQRKALRYYIRVTAYHDRPKKEIVNVQPNDNLPLLLKSKQGKTITTGCGNGWFLQTTFGVVDSGVIPHYAFDGCVLDL